MTTRRSLAQLYAQEFSNYNSQKLVQDFFAGCTVAAVALPLALAFGVASGSTAAAGLVTAIVSGIVIGLLSGASYQISGPTGAMSAVLIVLAQKYGMTGVWMAGMLAGLLLLIIGILRLGRFIAFVPAPVISGFTSGIAIIIAVGQFDNFLGVHTPGAESAAAKFLGYFSHPFTPQLDALIIGILVVLVMLFWPKRLNAKVPASLASIILATAVSSLGGLSVETIGEIPTTLILPERLSLAAIPWENMTDFIFPTLTIAALGAVESLLCGAVGGNMTGIRLQANQELVGQGIGNVLIPFVGGVPATAAIARTSVSIKSGGQTRLVSVFHSLVLLASMFALGPLISRVPLTALAGVLIVTAWRMNEWEAIQFYFSRRFKTGISTFLITLVATVTLDLTQAILIGTFISGAVFLNEVARMDIDVESVEVERLRQRGIEVEHDCSHIRVAYISGPLFFAATGHFSESFSDLGTMRYLILSMRGVPLLDASGLRVLEDLHERLQARGGRLMLAGVVPRVLTMLERGELVDAVGRENIFWSSDQAIVAASKLDA